MTRIFVHQNGAVFNVTNDTMAELHLSRGARELTADEITAAGMNGYERYISPLNTKVTEDGAIVFTPPSSDDFLMKQKEAIERIDKQTHAAITAGFTYEINTGYHSEILHFNFDQLDQINFNSTVMKILLGSSDPITWVGYRKPSNERIELSLTADMFYPLYLASQTHKETYLNIGKDRKKTVRDLTFESGGIPALEQLFSEYGV